MNAGQTSAWASIASRMVSGLDVWPGELVQVRDHAGRLEVLQADFSVGGRGIVKGGKVIGPGD